MRTTRLRGGDEATFDAVVFDLDGTLTDTLEDIADAMNRVLSAQRAPAHDYAAYRSMCSRRPAPA